MSEEKEEMLELIEEYQVEYEGCGRSECNECSFLPECYNVAKQREDSEWAKSIDYNGCATEEEFWEELLG